MNYASINIFGTVNAVAHKESKSTPGTFYVELLVTPKVGKGGESTNQVYRVVFKCRHEEDAKELAGHYASAHYVELTGEPRFKARLSEITGQPWVDVLVVASAAPQIVMGSGRRREASSK